jgi:radical SAM superfamily enzyme YgiQ (UPF0313 family)
MNVLLVNPAYPQTYWSLDKVQRMLGKKLTEPPLGLLTVAALLPESWDLKVIELRIQQITEDEWDACDILFVSGMSVQSAGILETIRTGRKKNKTVVVGGPWVFHFSEEALAAGADIVVKGEAEQIVPQLLSAIEQGTSGIVIASDTRADLNDSPAPRYDLLDINSYTTLEVQFSRGCPFRCEFCDVTLMLGRKVRTKAPQQILKELQNLYDLGWRSFVFFTDDNFIGNLPQTKALLKELIPWMEERDHPFEFITQATVTLAKDPEMLSLMVQAGFFKVFLGIETLDEESLKLAKKTQNTATDLNQACQTINRAGLQIIAGCIIGFDNERPGADQRLIDFAIQNNIPEMFITMLHAQPGTDMWIRLENEGRLKHWKFDKDIGSQTGLSNFVPTRPLVEIAEEFINLYQVLYDPGFYVERSFRHIARMEPSPLKKSFSIPSLPELRAVMITLYRQGVRYPSRWKFWKYFFTAMFTFPSSRFEQFLSACVMGEHYFEFRDTVNTKLRENLQKASRGEENGNPEDVYN